MTAGPGNKTLVLCDFDGTVCAVDMGNAILNRFTMEGWRTIDEAYCSGAIGSREAYERVAGLIRAGEAELLEYVDAYGRMDEHFPGFCELCRQRGFDVMIVSDGLGFYIEAILKRYNLAHLPYYANRVRFQGEGKLEITFPEWNPECDRCGTCKRGIVRRFRHQYERLIYVGNGHSDVCSSKEADLIFAKEVLYEKCREEGTACLHYETFKDVQDYLFHT